MRLRSNLTRNMALQPVTISWATTAMLPGGLRTPTCEDPFPAGSTSRRSVTKTGAAGEDPGAAVELA
jgi:hypothetical protein